jgi:hypothetical protein
MNRFLTKWITKPLSELTDKQWELLCDRCGLCCIHKIENQEGEIFLTDVACKYLDISFVSCRCYHNRAKKQKNCKILTPDNIKDNVCWLPETCAYRRRYENKPLPDWHPLLSKNLDSLRKAGINIRNKVISENLLPEIDWEDHIVDNDYFYRSLCGF